MCCGSSEAAPHVAGVAARYLQNHSMATPAEVWTAIHAADDVSTTAIWPGVLSAGSGSPNELLHWGSLNNGTNDGDPHLTTVGGIHYDFQGAGEFVALRDGNGLEIQTRQTSGRHRPSGHESLYRARELREPQHRRRRAGGRAPRNLSAGI